jgi:glycosyltransferase involved in cell wall biosynthesis
MKYEKQQPRPKRPRRILFVITDLDAGGAEKCCAQLAIGLDRARWEPSVCSLAAPGVLADELSSRGIPVHSLYARGARDFSRSVWRLTRIMRRTRPELVQTFLFHANVVGRLAARCAGVPRVFSSIRVAEKRHRYHLVVENLTCRLSDRIVCVSQAVGRFTRRHSHVPPQRLLVITNGVDVDAIDGVPGIDRRALGILPDALLALYVGRLDRQKGVDVLLHAFARVRHRLPQLALVVAGAGPERDALVALARELGIDAHAHFLGWRGDVPALCTAADFLVMPSRWEGMPNAVLEAMAAGLPVIATRVEGSSELVQDGDTGKLVASDSVEELADSMIALATDRATRERYGRNGRDRVRQAFSLQRMIADYERLYESRI